MAETTKNSTPSRPAGNSALKRQRRRRHEAQRIRQQGQHRQGGDQGRDRAIADQHRAGGDRHRQEQGKSADHAAAGVAEQRDAGDIDAEQQHEPRVGALPACGDRAQQEEIRGRKTAVTVV
jgi:hypothetical protein